MPISTSPSSVRLRGSALTANQDVPDRRACRHPDRPSGRKGDHSEKMGFTGRGEAAWRHSSTPPCAWSAVRWTRKLVARAAELLQYVRTKRTQDCRCRSRAPAATLAEIALSDVLERGFVTYSNAAKETMVGVTPTTLARHGAVSRKTQKPWPRARSHTPARGVDHRKSLDQEALCRANRSELVFDFAAASRSGCSSRATQYGDMATPMCAAPRCWKRWPCGRAATTETASG